MDNIQWLEKWYSSQCDGDWEHDFGIKITTLDNPGWHIVIDLTHTGFEDKSFNKLIIENTQNDWIHCSKNNSTFSGACGPLKLNELIKVFRVWVEKNGN